MTGDTSGPRMPAERRRWRGRAARRAMQVVIRKHLSTLSPDLLYPFASRWSGLLIRGWASVRDSGNRERFGPAAPRFAEEIWIDPSEVEHFDRGGRLWDSARVVGGVWPLKRRAAIEDDIIYQACLARWVHGLPWAATGEVDRMEMAIARRGTVQGCRTRTDILARCDRLDVLFKTIERERKVRQQSEVEPGGFRAVGGIGVHLGPHGIPIRAQNGRHRFAIARILRIPLIPARIGIVHRTALEKFEEFRSGPAYR
jgi:hypothetical protein